MMPTGSARRPRASISRKTCRRAGRRLDIETNARAAIAEENQRSPARRHRPGAGHGQPLAYVRPLPSGRHALRQISPADPCGSRRKIRRYRLNLRLAFELSPLAASHRLHLRFVPAGRRKKMPPHSRGARAKPAENVFLQASPVCHRRRHSPISRADRFTGVEFRLFKATRAREGVQQLAITIDGDREALANSSSVSAGGAERERPERADFGNDPQHHGDYARAFLTVVTGPHSVRSRAGTGRTETSRASCPENLPDFLALGLPGHSSSVNHRAHCAQSCQSPGRDRQRHVVPNPS